MATKDPSAKSHERMHYSYALTGDVPGVGKMKKGGLRKAEGGQVIKPTEYKKGGRRSK